MPFMDHFLEEVVVKHKNGLNRALYYFSWIIIVFSAIIASMTLGTLSTNFSWFSVILIVITGGVAVYTYFFHDKLLTEYEYTFTNGALDFAEVYNNKKRKSLGSLNVRNVEAFGKVSSSAFQRYLNMPGIKRMNWFLNPEPGSGAVLLLLHQGLRQEDDHPGAQRRDGGLYPQVPAQWSVSGVSNEGVSGQQRYDQAVRGCRGGGQRNAGKRMV